MTVNRPKAIPNKQFENEQVIVTEWCFESGAETGWHCHDYDYIVVPGLDGKLLLETKLDDSLQKTLEQNTSELKQGQSYFRSAGVEHNVVNANDFSFSFVEIELK